MIERFVLLCIEYIWYLVRYKYYGYLCVEFVDFFVIIDDGDYCWDVDGVKVGGIRYNYFVGILLFFDDFGGEGFYVLGLKFVSVKVFELYVENGLFDECLILFSVESGGMTGGMFR